MRIRETSKRLTLGLTLAVLATTSTARAEQATGGPILEVATREVDAPAVALAPGGKRALVVWSRLDGIHSALLRGADLATVGSELAIHQRAGVHLAPDVAVDGKGRFAVVWQGGEASHLPDPPGGDGSGSGIYLRRLDAAGSPRDDERRVNRDPYLDQSSPRIAAGADGRLAIAWSDRFGTTHEIVPAHSFVAFGAGGRRLFADVVRSGSGLAEVRLGGVAAAPGFLTVGATDFPLLCDDTGLTRQVEVDRVDWKGRAIALPARFQDDDADSCNGPLLLDVLSSGYGPLAFIAGNANYNVARFDPETGARPEHRRVVAELEPCTASGCPQIVAVAGDARGRFVAIWEIIRPIDCGFTFELAGELYGRDGKLRSGRFPISAGRQSLAATTPDAAFADDGTLLVAWVERDAAGARLLARRLELR